VSHERPDGSCSKSNGAVKGSGRVPFQFQDGKAEVLDARLPRRCETPGLLLTTRFGWKARMIVRNGREDLNEETRIDLYMLHNCKQVDRVFDPFVDL
jgi:hypothetical protein